MKMYAVITLTILYSAALGLFKWAGLFDKQPALCWSVGVGISQTHGTRTHIIYLDNYYCVAKHSTMHEKKMKQ